MTDNTLTHAESDHFWKTALNTRLAPELADDINAFETEILLKKQGKIDDKVFAESRLRRGAYGQRYDNGRRNDGKADRPIPFPSTLTKGPNTMWDAPGMLRIKLPYGAMTPDQMDVLADLAEEYSDDIVHITTRQDVQLHFIHIEDTPSIFRRLGAVDITTKEACGNSVRNVTGCPISGVCTTESFDTTAYANATFRFLLGHPDTQDFGRKFKISFSGCVDKPCALAKMHDLGVIAETRIENGKTVRGFQVYVGGGLGAIPYQAARLTDFLPEAELLPMMQAVARVFARLGEKKNRNKARVKFLVAQLGIDEFRRLVDEERKILPHDPRWTSYLSSLQAFDETPLHALDAPLVTPLSGTRAHDEDASYLAWRRANAEAQKQTGYVAVTLPLPLGDISAAAFRKLADVCRQYVGASIRTTVEQNIVLRFVREVDLPALYRDLATLDLAAPYAGTIVDVVSCPGTDTCKLGTSSSRGLAGELRHRLAARSASLDAAIQSLRIKVSGCFNSCGQHHIADIGFYGVGRKVGNYMVPHFQLVLGGEPNHNAGDYGLAVTALPSKAIPAAVDRLATLYLTRRDKNETFQAFTRRLGKAEIKKTLDDLAVVPAYTDDPSFYTDWGDVREYSKSDIGVGECAGEIVSTIDFGLTAGDRTLFDAHLLYEKGDYETAANKALQAMLDVAKGFVRSTKFDIPEDPDLLANDFRAGFCDTELFYDPFAGDRFAALFFKAVSERNTPLDAAHVRKRLEEAQLFIDAGHAANARMAMA